MKKFLAGLMMVCAFGSAAAQSTQRGASEDKDHPKCEDQHDCRAAAKATKTAKRPKAVKGDGVAVGIGVAAVVLAAAVDGGGHDHARRPTPSSP